MSGNKHSHYKSSKHGHRNHHSNSHSKEDKTRRLMVHQTDPNAAASIHQSKIMRPGTGGALGAAIYFCKTMDGCDARALHHGTYLMADVYLGKTEANAHFNNNTGFDSIVSGDKLPMYVVNDSNRVRNVRYLDGTIPPNTNIYNIEMRDRMPLIYAATAQNAANIIKKQKIPEENRSDIAGTGIYLWQNIPDAKRFALYGAETFLAAEVYFNDSCFQDTKFPKFHDLHKYETFRGNYQNTHYFMVKNPSRITKIHYIGGKRPPR